MESSYYFDQLFGENRGYIALAAKRGKKVWFEKTFLWPADRHEVESWLGDHRDHDLFVCPALRRTDARRKKDGAHLQWLWADVDFQDIPERRRAAIKARAEKLGTFVVASGSGENLHVYIQLTRPAELETWRRLNAGLRTYLMADAKHTDNALLRVPGTRNYKPEGGRVQMMPGTGKTVPADKLLAHPIWKATVVRDDEPENDGTWEAVDVSTVFNGSIKRLVTMELDEALGRFGTRHAAVFQVTSKLIKRGLTANQIHTLMSNFKAGLSKQAEERGYDLHQDVARCLAGHPTIEAVQQDAALSVTEQLEEADAEDVLKEKVLRRVEAMDVEDLARQYRAQRDFMPPPDDVSYTLATATSMDRPPREFTIQGLAATGQNVTITGQYKAGKTMLAANLVRSLCDHTPFLDDRKVRELAEDESVGLWSLEMNHDDLLDQYLIPQGVQRGDKLHLLNARGYGMNVLTDVGRAWAVDWLRSRSVGVWVLDSWARICRMAGVDENDNGAVLSLLHRLDEIKHEAGVTDLFVIAHMGRMTHEEGRERARGATVFDDWADARWVFTRDGQTRFLAVDGRSVEAMEATSVAFDEATRHMSLGSGGKNEARLAGTTQLVTQIVAEQGKVNTKTLTRLVREAGGTGQRGSTAIRDAILEAVDSGFIRKVRGAGREQMFEVTPSESDHVVKGGNVKNLVTVDFSRVRDSRR